MQPIAPIAQPHPEEVTRSLLRVTVSKDGSGRDFASGAQTSTQLRKLDCVLRDGAR
jgi:hypothetical protein